MDRAEPQQAQESGKGCHDAAGSSRFAGDRRAGSADSGASQKRDELPAQEHEVASRRAAVPGGPRNSRKGEAFVVRFDAPIRNWRNSSPFQQSASRLV